ncbi:hypothetical protein [Streptomyces sp. NRRL F-5755]|nr:hypothetical protein [Streptomyces sp. NRRL F-5755]
MTTHPTGGRPGPPFDAGESGHAGRAFLDGILESFWARTGGG